MATTFKVRYKNHCTPQEQIALGGRYYLDSDVGRKLTGNAETSVTLASTGTLTTGVAITDSATSIASSKDFVYVKNTGSTEVVISLTSDSSAEYVIALAENEAFASEISTSANVRVKTLSGTSTIEHFSET
jgi:hypothetical protein|tara:strand:- start:100 stop:492 length:393 start_codon:yes stop_codon:yes gene_type:complete